MAKAAAEMDLQYLADVEEIWQLGHRYVNLCDDGFDAEALADLFTVDCVWDSTEGFGPFEGGDELVGFFTNFGGMVLFTLHGLVNAEIEINGDAATGQRSVVGAVTFKGENSPQDTWSFLDYRTECARVDGLWRFKRMTAGSMAGGPYDAGWAESVASK